MLILIAEAKTMASTEQRVEAADFASHTPVYEGIADLIMKRFAGMSVPEISGQTGLTLSLANRLYKYAYEFPNKQLGLKTIEAFTGVVFKSLDYSSLNPSARSLCESDVRLISSLYGWLRPSDIIKPYRLDYSSKLISTDGKELSASLFWRKDVTIRLVRNIKEYGHKEILNLLPGDAAKSIDWKLVKNFAKVWKVDFTDALTEATPQAGKLKEIRGKLLRQILMEGVSEAGDITKIVSDSFVCDGSPKYPDHLHFLC